MRVAPDRVRLTPQEYFLTNRGGLCSKGWTAAELLDHPERLTAPLHALQAMCPHRGGPLADGLVDGAQVVYPLRSHAFRLADGQCTTGARSVRAYQVTVENGELVLRPFGKAPVTTVP